MAENGDHISFSVKQLSAVATAAAVLFGGGGTWFQEQRLGPQARATDNAIRALDLAEQEIGHIRENFRRELGREQQAHEQTLKRLIRMMEALGCIDEGQADQILQDELSRLYPPMPSPVPFPTSTLGGIASRLETEDERAD